MSRWVSATGAIAHAVSFVSRSALPGGTGAAVSYLNQLLTFARQKMAVPGNFWGVGQMESNYRFYLRRACEERTAAHRAITEPARAWHAKLAIDFAERAATSGMSLTAHA